MDENSRPTGRFKTGEPFRKGQTFKRLPPDDPIYRAGWIVGERRAVPLTKRQVEAPSEPPATSDKPRPARGRGRGQQKG
jgi:hypothetical protein